MSNHYEWGHAETARVQVVAGPIAHLVWDVPEAVPDGDEGVTESHALGVFNDNGDGVILQGGRKEIVALADAVYAYVHQVFDAGPELGVIPGRVWSAFLAQECQLDRESPGPVSLSAVLRELLGMVERHRRCPEDFE